MSSAPLKEQSITLIPDIFSLPRSHILSLPAEIRLMIWSFLSILDLLQVVSCQRLFAREVQPILFKNGTLRIHRLYVKDEETIDFYRHPLRFLDHIPEYGFALLKSIILYAPYKPCGSATYGEAGDAFFEVVSKLTDMKIDGSTIVLQFPRHCEAGQDYLGFQDASEDVLRLLATRETTSVSHSRCRRIVACFVGNAVSQCCVKSAKKFLNSLIKRVVAGAILDSLVIRCPQKLRRAPPISPVGANSVRYASWEFDIIQNVFKIIIECYDEEGKFFLMLHDATRVHHVKRLQPRSQFGSFIFNEENVEKDMSSILTIKNRSE